MIILNIISHWKQFMTLFKSINPMGTGVFLQNVCINNLSLNLDNAKYTNLKEHALFSSSSFVQENHKLTQHSIMLTADTYIMN